ncbi:hypothetical protein C0995_014410 [Termitomyces sp. Mi166|nr:hypothetical protein C0995_014410 [Termitomyces sp. Mi166\
MFELTGALNYILPTMIVLLVTKAVGDFLGTNGIADEMIRFNGFPFLEKEDHAYNVSVSAVMRTEIHTLVESGMNVKQIEDILEATNVKGFPIESADGLRHIIGYIGRTELRYVLDRGKKIPRVDDDTRCQFALRDSEHSAHGVSFGIEEEAVGTSFFESALSEGGLRFWPWVNLTPITVSPELPLEIVMQLFKRMGPRVILVENHGVLMGLVTVKDVLKFIATKPAHELSWDDRGGLDGLLEEVWTWTTDNIHRALYSSSLAAYTLKQFSAARAALDNDEDAAAKLPANVKTYGYNVSKPSTGAHNQSSIREQSKPSRLRNTYFIGASWFPSNPRPSQSMKPKLDK